MDKIRVCRWCDQTVSSIGIGHDRDCPEPKLARVENDYRLLMRYHKAKMRCLEIYARQDEYDNKAQYRAEYNTARKEERAAKAALPERVKRMLENEDVAKDTLLRG